MQRGNPDSQWIDLATKFPATLVKDLTPERLEDGQTPDAYGLGLERPGSLYYNPSTGVGSRLTAWSTVSSPTNAPSGVDTWHYYFNRLWGYVAAGGTTFYHGANGYGSVYVIQDTGNVHCDQESSSITGAHPFGGSMGISKADELYVIPNAENPSAGFGLSYVRKSIGAASTNFMMGLDNALYIANTNGIFAHNGNEMNEITLPIRANLGTFTSASITALNADFNKKRIIGVNGATLKFVIDTTTGALFDYGTTGFRFTSRTLVAPDGAPLIIDKIALAYEYTAAARAALSWQVKINDTWKTQEQNTNIQTTDFRGRVELCTEYPLACRRWAFRLTSLPQSFYIYGIQAKVKMSAGSQGYTAQ